MNPIERLKPWTVEQVNTIAFDVAQGTEDPDVILTRHGVDPIFWKSLCEFEPFRVAVSGYVTELREKGHHFRLQSSLLAEKLLPVLYEIACDEEQPASARIDAAGRIVKWAGLEPKEKEAPAQAQQIVVNIDLSGVK